MLKPSKASFRQRLGEADPVFSMGQRLWDWTTFAWGPITVSGLWSALVSAAIYFSDWWVWIGPPGAVLLALGVFLLCLSILTFIGYFRAMASTKRIEAEMFDDWRQIAHNVNPLDREYHTKRIRLSDLANPVTRLISNKRFIDCELTGPANVLLRSTKEHAFSITGAGFLNCDLVVIKPGEIIYNAVVLEDANIIGGKLLNITLYIFPDIVPTFAAMGGSFITLTGDLAIDNLSRPDIGGKKQS